MKLTEESLEAIQAKALEQFKSGESLFGKNGAFAPLLKGFLEKALEGEMEGFLTDTERENGNKRNGKKSKVVKSSAGEISIEIPQDRKSGFNPDIVKKRQRILASTLEKKILGLYGLGMSYQDISSQIEEMYGTSISASVLTEITDKIIPEMESWRNRPLEKVYPIVWLDAIHYKVRESGKVAHKALYSVLGINKEGKKEILGLYLSESEGANFWLQVLTDLHNRGVKDILIACTDNLKGFTEAIQSIFTKTEVQLCIVHQIRNSLKYVASKDQKVFLSDLKLVYRADTLSIAEDQLIYLEEKWGKKYPKVIESWNRNWENLSAYFAYTEPIRKLIYTTNAVEGYHRMLRKVTKTKGAFTSENALLKLVYLATLNSHEKWKTPLRNWSTTVQQLAIKFEDRFKLDI